MPWTGGAYRKQGGVWTKADRVYVKHNGVWKPADEVYAKHAGTWQLTHLYDVTPPPPPEISLEIVDTEYWEEHLQKSGRYIKVGVRQPLGAHDEMLKRIRVLTTYNGKSPTTQYGGRQIQSPADSDPYEPWMDWYYNGFGDGVHYHHDSSNFQYKRFPRNASSQTNIAAGKEFFAAWAQDLNGNWSIGNFASIVVPKKGVDAANKVTKEARFQVTATGTFKKERFGFGRPTQGVSPNSRGLLFYGNQLRSQIGLAGEPQIKTGRIRLERRPDDGGKANANVYIFRHGYAYPAGVGNNLDIHEIIKLGQIEKGATKWFNIPQAYLTKIENDADNMKGFGFNFKDPAKSNAQANDFSIFNAKDDSIRSGEVHMVWTEKL